TRDEGVAPRSWLAGAGFKPPQAGVVKRCYEAEGSGFNLPRLFEQRLEEPDDWRRSRPEL
ncbi:MAG: hypothetical protein AAGA73_00615, partial [Pseudomonadota bacterium]